MGDDDRRWLTYREIGEALGIKASSAKRLSFRRHWPHRPGNDGLARVGVPVAELRHAPGDTHPAVTGGDSGTAAGADTGDAPGDRAEASAALALALDRIEALAVQAGHARAEVERLRAELAAAVRGRAAAEAVAEVSAHTAAEMQAAAVDAWRTAAEVARHLAHPAPVPTRRRWGWLRRAVSRA